MNNTLLRLQARALDSLSEGVSVTDIDTGLISYANPAVDRLFGYEPGGVTAQQVRAHSAYPPEQNEQRVAELTRQLQEHGEWAGEWFNRRKDGSPFYTYARITTVEVDGRKYAVCVQEDVTKRRLEALDELLPTLAGVLDIREVFERVSAIARTVLPHDLLSLPLLTEDKKEIILHAVAGTTIRFPERIPLLEHHQPLLTTKWDYVIYPDLAADPLERRTPLAEAGYRAVLRLPVRLHGEIVGAMDFASFQPRLYTAGDVLVARRIVDHVALALSHQRLSQEAQRAAEARATARALEDRVHSLTAELSAVTGYGRIVGASEAWKGALKQATQVAATESTVMLLGDSGTGKEVLARFIHRASARSGGPFVAINCAALPEPLLESELFGFERGAFTGAQQAKPGQIERAAGGVLFLDEVAEMSPSAQAKFLRVLQEREFQRLGGTRTVKANIRVIAATNRDLRAAVQRGGFREDLYYRLQVFEIQLPPLRVRRDDILPLSEAFLDEIAKSLGRPPAGISREARDELLNYSWPGNVRELRNMLERAAILCEGGLITTEHLRCLPVRPLDAAPPMRSDSLTPASLSGNSSTLRVMERSAIQQALLDARYNKSHAAKMLGLSRKQLYVRLRHHGLD